MAHLPYLILGFVVFVLFLIAARIAKGILNTAGRRTRLDRTLADLLGRLTSAFTIILGLFVAAVVIFPTFNPGDLIAGLGITSVVIGFAFKDVLQNFFAGISFSGDALLLSVTRSKVGNYEGTVEEITTRSTKRSVLTVTDNVMTGIKLALDEAGIEIPYPHTVVLHQSPATSADGTSPQHR